MENKWRRGYPQISLEQAIERIKQVYEQEYTNSAPREVIATSMGYGGINGASSRILSAFSQYGLLESLENDLYRVSEDALNMILHRRGEKERVESVKKLAFNPDIFGEFREKYPNNIPSDDNLKAFLIKSNYHPSSVKDIIKSYKDTLQYLHLETSGFDSNTEDNSSSNTKNISEREISRNSPNVEENFTQSEGIIPLVFKISRQSTARIYFSGEVTQNSIEKLISLLDISKDTFPTEDEIKADTKT